MICGSPSEDPHSENHHSHSSAALRGSSSPNLYMGHRAAAKLVFGLQRSHVLAKATGVFEQAHKQVELAAPRPPQQDTEDSGSLHQAHHSRLYEETLKPNLCRETHLKQTSTTQDHIKQLEFEELPCSFQVLALVTKQQNSQEGPSVPLGTPIGLPLP